MDLGPWGQEDENTETLPVPSRPPQGSNIKVDTTNHLAPVERVMIITTRVGVSRREGQARGGVGREQVGAACSAAARHGIRTR
eukprot:1196014-Prorocentrum_minimum.AAC.1